MTSFRTLLAAASVLCLAACGSTDEEDAYAPAQPVGSLYEKGIGQIGANDYKEAIETFEDVERQYPYSPWASRGQIMAGYSAWRSKDFDGAIAIFERFVKMHPTSPSAPYAWYMIALCQYDQISDVGRDQKMTRQALAALEEVIRRYPDSDYARDAKFKRDLTVDHLAGKEMDVGRYYLKRKDYVAAIGRFQFVVDNYQTTNHVPEALHRLTEAYLALGVVPEAKKNAAVLGANYPGNEWYKRSYELMKPYVKDEAPAPAKPAS